MCSVKYTASSVQCTVLTVQCAGCSVQCVMFSVHWEGHYERVPRVLMNMSHALEGFRRGWEAGGYPAAAGAG